MTPVLKLLLAFTALIILTLALSASDMGAKFVQGALILAIVAVILRPNAIQQAKVIQSFRDVLAPLGQPAAAPPQPDTQGGPQLTP